MVKKRDRAIALFFAGLFIFSSSALTIAVIAQSISDSNAKKKTATPITSTINKPEAKKMDNTKLAGSPLEGFAPMSNIPELQKIDLVPGTGNEVKEGATVTVHYTGAVASTGIVFQSSKDGGKEVTFPLSGVIPGWTKGVPGMKEGGTRRLLIPAALAYGANPPQGSGIPANADLVFDISLSKIGQ